MLAYIPKGGCNWPGNIVCTTPPDIDFNGRAYCLEHFYRVLVLRNWLRGSFHDFLAIDISKNSNTMRP